MRHESYIDDLPVIAILRGLTPERAVPVARILIDAGIRVIEVPLNSPKPLDSIERIAAEFGELILSGAGTVLHSAEVASIHAAGGRLIVSPNTNIEVIDAAVRAGMTVMPGFATATEAFAAISAGARLLKLFPASSYGPSHVKALKDVLPPDTEIYAVGGISASGLAPWLTAGARGFGIGSELFRPSYSDSEIAERARRFVAAVRHAREHQNERDRPRSAG